MKNVKEDEVFTQEEILEFIGNWRSGNEKRDRAFIALSYLSGGRVGEIIRTVMKRHVTYVKHKGRRFLVIRLPRTEKNRRHPARGLPVPIDREGFFVSFIEEYAKTLKPDDVLFPFCRTTGWSIIRKATGERHHWMRHCRISHLITLYDYNDQELVRFAGWSDSKPLSTYAHLRTRDLMEKMR